MPYRRLALFLAALSLSSVAATYRTPNFTVHAANEDVAKQVGQYAEKYRKEKAIEWLGKEMPQWGQPCPIKVTLTAGGPGGATTFAFDRGAILSQEMHVEGPLDRILASVLPHEVTHTVFAYHFRQPLPRWADEGGSVLSEDEAERKRHDELVRQQLAGGKAFRLRVLFDMRQYPKNSSDVLTLYAQGYSLARYLVETSSKQQFLAFVGDGMQNGWDRAVKNHYGMDKLEDLEEAWLQWMRNSCRPAAGVLVKNDKPTQAAPARRPMAELGMPLYPGEVTVRGLPPETDHRPATNPKPPRSAERSPADGWSPLGNPTSNPARMPDPLPTAGNGVILLPPIPAGGPR